MDLLTLIVTLVVVGVILWAVNTYIPMDPTIKRILNIAVIVLVVLWLLVAMGFMPNLGQIRFGG